MTKLCEFCVREWRKRPADLTWRGMPVCHPCADELRLEQILDDAVNEAVFGPLDD
jgi:hypothetical protein